MSSKRSALTFLLPILLVAFIIQSCGDNSTNFRKIEYTPPEPYDINNAVSDSTTEDGLTIYVIEEGYGPCKDKPDQCGVVSRDQLRVRYTGRTEDGEVFESTYRNGNSTPGILRNLTPNPITSPQGRRINPLVDGFRRGLLGMVEGEKRKLVIPPELGYGTVDDEPAEGSLENKTLYFDVELVEILN